MNGAMILSLGGSPEPLIKSITTHKPAFVCFLASQESLSQLGEVLRGLSAAGHSVAHHTVVINDINDLVQCYTKALECAQVLREREFTSDRVIVDYTGGTKTMSVALSLATLGQGFRFSYVGGTDRTKEGLGQVISGTEFVQMSDGPWEIFSVEERKRIALHINNYQFPAALNQIEGLLARNSLLPPDRPLFKNLKQVLEGYRAWEQFRHKEAIRSLSQATKEWQDYIRPHQSHEGLNQFYTVVRENKRFLEDLQQQSDNFKEVCWPYVEDLVANAERRGEEGKYDDAVARLYRATEMIAQIQLARPPLHCKSDDVPIEKIPGALREEYIKKYQDPTEKKIKLPLFATYQLLQTIGDPKGEQFFSREKEFQALLRTRNYSILAHGIEPVKPETFQQLLALIRECFQVERSIQFPKLKLW